MRYLLDTCIVLYMLNETGEMSNDVEAIVTDYGNRLYICAASIRELSAAWHKYQYMQKKWKTPSEMIDVVHNQFGVETLYPQREHYQTFVNLRWNLEAKHTDTSDHLIIAHAITEHLPLISSDGKFDFYCKQGLNFIFNKKK